MKKELNQISVDIILPNYNSAPYLSKTIDSIIDQTFKNWKLIIVDDSSNIETKKKLKEHESNPNINIINPLSRVDLVIDHSVMVDSFGHPSSYQKNVEKEFLRNKERYEFLKW